MSIDSIEVCGGGIELPCQIKGNFMLGQDPTHSYN